MNKELLKDFTKYCEFHPTERFWQSLLNWSELPYIAWTNKPPMDYKDKDFRIGDTYNFEHKNK